MLFVTDQLYLLVVKDMYHYLEGKDSLFLENRKGCRFTLLWLQYIPSGSDSHHIADTFSLDLEADS